MVTRFHHYSNADGYLSVLKRLEPNSRYVVAFELEAFEFEVEAAEIEEATDR